MAEPKDLTNADIATLLLLESEEAVIMSEDIYEKLLEQSYINSTNEVLDKGKKLIRTIKNLSKTM